MIAAMLLVVFVTYITTQFTGVQWPLRVRRGLG